MNIEQFMPKLWESPQGDPDMDAISWLNLFRTMVQEEENNGKGELDETASYDINREMQLIDSRYRVENRLLEAISQGDEEGAWRALMDYGKLMRSPQQKVSPTSLDAIRDFKNSVHTMNTLFRKAIEGNHVHPIYIHESSSDFGSRIEQADSMEALAMLIGEMILRYCYLVRKYSVAIYSEPVRNAMLYIDLNLVDAISTREIAAAQFLSANYLSTRFHEETGKTISDFILEKRIKMACKLLRTTKCSIQEVATSVGISDASYFSKQFKKIKGVSPLQYQKKMGIGL